MMTRFKYYLYNTIWYLIVVIINMILLIGLAKSLNYYYDYLEEREKIDIVDDY